MIASLILGAALLAQPATGDTRADFISLCVETRAQPDAVRRVLLQQTGWEPAAGAEGLTIWRRTTGEQVQTLTLGRRDVGGAPKDICSIQLAPGNAALSDGFPAGLGPVTGEINAEANLYFVAASGEAVTAGDFDFVAFSHGEDVTTLILLHPVR